MKIAADSYDTSIFFNIIMVVHTFCEEVNAVATLAREKPVFLSKYTKTPDVRSSLH